jgi:hypothetical protein
MISPHSLERPEQELPRPSQGEGLAVSPGFTTAIGGLLPMAPCGRTSFLSLRQASNFSDAAASVRNQWAFRHSARKRPLKASMKALSVGLPGLEKSRVTPWA